MRAVALLVMLAMAGCLDPESAGPKASPDGRDEASCQRVDEIIEDGLYRVRIEGTDIVASCIRMAHSFVIPSVGVGSLDGQSWLVLQPVGQSDCSRGAFGFFYSDQKFLLTAAADFPAGDYWLIGQGARQSVSIDVATGAVGPGSPKDVRPPTHGDAWRGSLHVESATMSTDGSTGRWEGTGSAGTLFMGAWVDGLLSQGEEVVTIAMDEPPECSGAQFIDAGRVHYDIPSTAAPGEALVGTALVTPTGPWRAAATYEAERGVRQMHVFVVTLEKVEASSDVQPLPS